MLHFAIPGEPWRQWISIKTDSPDNENESRVSKQKIERDEYPSE